MAEVTKRTLVLTFGTPAGGEVKLTINKPKEGLTGKDVSDAMEAIINTKSFGEVQTVSSKVDAKFVIQETESLDISEE